MKYSLNQRLKELSALSKFSYEEIIGPKRHADLIEVRHKLMVQMHKEYPKVSINKLGLLFNKDRSTVSVVIKKFKNV